MHLSVKEKMITRPHTNRMGVEGHFGGIERTNLRLWRMQESTARDEECGIEPYHEQQEQLC